MSIISKLTEAVVQFIPDRGRDMLSEAERLIGKPIDRLDGRDKVTGAALFSAEYPLEKLAYASLVYSTVAKGKITSIDVGEAEKAAGVIAVITHKNAPKMKDPPLFSPTGGSDAAGSKANVLNTDEIFWNGQPVAVIVAETLDRAEHAASLVKVEYRKETADTSFAEGKARLEVPKSIMGEDTEVNRGDAEGRLQRPNLKSITPTQRQGITITQSNSTGPRLFGTGTS